MAINTDQDLHPETNMRFDLDEPFGPPNSPATIPNSGSDTPGYINLDASSLDLPNVQAHLVKSLSALSLKQKKDVHLHETDSGTDKIITVAISGCSSSGKTTLTLLLSEIFTMTGMGSPTSIAKYTTTSDTTPKAVKQNLLIHQDDFFLNKGACSMVTFTSTRDDVDFCHKTLEKDEIDEYIISYTGTRVITQYTEYPVDRPILATMRSMSYESGVGDGTGIEAYKPEFRISGPDTDSVMAVNFQELLNAVKHVKQTGTLAPVSKKDTEGYGDASVIRVTVKDVTDLKQKYASLIEEMKEKVAKFARQQSVKNAESRFAGSIIKSPIANSKHDSKASIRSKFCFVDGFLLYTNAHRDAATKSEKTDVNDFVCATQSTKKFRDLEQKMKAGLLTDEEIEEVEKLHYEAAVTSMKKLMPLFDVKLFLTTSKGVARSRRHDRHEYVDQPAGERRPGQMWKTTGYFEQVAWRNYLKEHDWLVEINGEVNEDVVSGKAGAGVIVREDIDASVEDTVEWAVNAILGVLEKTEGRTRKTKYSEETTMEYFE